MAGFANIPAERGPEGGIVSRSERRACVRIAQNGQCLLGLTTRGFSAWATHWATSDAARSGRARPASAVARGAGGPGGPDALVGLPGGPWRPRPATCPALLAQLFGCTQSESLSLTRGSERLPTSGRLGHIAGIPCARHNAGAALTSRGGAGRVPPPYKGLAGQKILDGALRIGCDGIGLVEGDAVLPVRQHQVDGAIRLISLATATPSAGAQSAERRS